MNSISDIFCFVLFFLYFFCLYYKNLTLDLSKDVTVSHFVMYKNADNFFRAGFSPSLCMSFLYLKEKYAFCL